MIVVLPVRPSTDTGLRKSKPFTTEGIERKHRETSIALCFSVSSVVKSS